MQWNQCAPQHAPQSHPMNIQAGGGLLEYLMLPSWPETCVFSARSQIMERDMQEADPGALQILPGSKVRLRKHSQISQFRHSPCPQGEKKTLRDLWLMPKFLSCVGSPQQWPHTICTWTTQITESHPAHHITQTLFVQSHQRSPSSK